MLTLELVNHCWKYWRLATLHLSQLCLNPPQHCRAVCTIVHAPAADDPKTADVLRYFGGLAIENVRWNFVELPVPQLCRRAIGRNLVCQATRADFVLLGDIDYCFGPGALDAAADRMRDACRREAKLMHPQIVFSSPDHAAGDAEIARVDRPRIIDLSTGYIPIELPRAIGGAQYFPGEVARKIGYLPDDPRFQRRSKVWRRTHEDVRFRYACGLRSVAIDVPGIYRVKHGKRGRFDIGVEL